MKLRIWKASIISLDWYPTEDSGGKQVLHVTAPLNKKIAEKLRCAGLCYDEQGIPRNFEGKLSLSLKISGSSVELGDYIYESPLIQKWKIGRKDGAADNDVALWLSCRIHFEGLYEGLGVWCRQQNKGEFSFAIQPAQGELFENDDDPVEPQLENATTTAPKSAGSVASRRQMELATAAPGKKADKPN